MATSSCPYCGAELPDPALRFCPSCGGQLPETAGQAPPVVPAAGFRRRIPFFFAAAGLVLVLVLAVILVQVFVLHAAPAPAAETAGTPAMAGPETGMTGSPPCTVQNRTTGSTPEVPVLNATSLETRVHGLVNKVRQEHGLPALGTDAALTSLARAHSRDMAENRYFGHLNLDERDATARGAAVGYLCHKDADPYFTYAIAENLYATERYRDVLIRDGRAIEYGWVSEEAIAAETVDAWMNSPDHRDNILDPGMGREGIGVALAAYGLVFVTEDFC